VFASLLQVIRDARNALGLSQKDFAQRVNEKISVIQDYESGKAIPNSQILAKFERILGVKLRGKINP
jgi:putative transcription factor